MREVQPISFDTGNNFHQKGPIVITPNVSLVNVPQQPNVIPRMIQIPPHAPTFMATDGGFQTQQPVKYGFTVQTTHSTSFLFLPARKRDAYRLSATVMPNIAGFCGWCGRIYDQIGKEILEENLLATSYDAKTVRDRNVRSRAFIDGFEAALFTFKNTGLSQPRSCVGPSEQH